MSDDGDSDAEEGDVVEADFEVLDSEE
jgi:hypothetical protein